MLDRKHFATLIAATLLVVFAAQAALGSPHNSAAFDEEYHLAAGYAYLRTGDPRLSTEHPPLVNVWNALPLVLLNPRLPLDSPAWQNAMTDDFGDAFLWQANPDRAVQLVLLGRLPIIALGVLLGAVVFRWARDLFGLEAGLLALALYAFDPNLIAHSRLSTTDLGLAAWTTIALWRLWVWLEKPARWNLVLAGAAMGAAMATKFTGLTLGPIAVLVALAHPVPASAKGGWWGEMARRFFGLLVAALVALSVIWAVYGLEVRHGLPAATYWHGLAKIWAEYSQGYPTFLLGQVSRTSWWYYFPLAFALKTPLLTQALLVAGVIAVFRRGRWRYASAVLIPPAVWMAGALFSPLAIGYRHILPLLPFVIILASRVPWPARSGQRSPRPPQGGHAGPLAAVGGRQVSKRCTPYMAPRLPWDVLYHPALAVGRLTFYALLFTWYLAGAVCIFPHHLSYFNELAGGPSNGDRWLVDSNLDWGQDLPALQQLMAERGIEQVHLAYFGTAMPEAYGIRYKPLPGFLRFLAGPEVDAYNPYTPEPGWYAISATSLRLGKVYHHVDLYNYFRDKVPVASAGYSINLYQVRYPEGTPVDRAVVTGQAVADFTPGQLGLLPAHRLIVKWSKSPDTSIYFPPSLNPAIDFAGAFSLTGYQVEQTHLQPGETISLTLTWQVGSAQIETPRPGYTAPLAAFVHLVERDPSRIVAQYDGWGTALTGLEAGDVIAQRVTIGVPPDAPPGVYRLLAGLYSPQTMQRLTALVPDSVADHVELSEITLR